MWNKNKIQRWDFSCQDSYEKCLKRITCFKGNFVCPDGNCVYNESMCNQPIERNGERNQIQCNDMTFVSNEKFCKKIQVMNMVNIYVIMVNVNINVVKGNVL